MADAPKGLWPPLRRVWRRWVGKVVRYDRESGPAIVTRVVAASWGGAFFLLSNRRDRLWMRADRCRVVNPNREPL